MRGLIPVCITLLAVSFGLLIASCNDSAIPEVEFPVPDEEQTTLIRPSDNPEPPELIDQYYALWAEIEQEKLDGQLDSTKVLEANKLAIELAKYDGMMAETFATLEIIIDGYSEGKSTEEVQKDLRERREELPFIASGIDEMDNCVQDCNERYEMDVNENEAWYAAQTTACIGKGARDLIKKPTVKGVIGSLVKKGVCIGLVTYHFHRSMDHSIDLRDSCWKNCFRLYGKPE